MKTILLFSSLFALGFNSPATDYDLTITWSNTNNSVSYAGIPSQMLMSGDYIDIWIHDNCGHLVYFEHKTGGGNSGTIYKSSFSPAVCLTDGTPDGNQYYIVKIKYYYSGGYTEANAYIFI